MKIAFLHTKNFFTTEILRHFRIALAHHEVVEWIDGKDAPAFDFDMLIAMSNVGRDLLLAQPKLILVQTASDGYEDVDIDAASELGIWVSYAPADLTGNATSVAEFAVLLLLSAARHLGETLTSLQGGPCQTAHAQSHRSAGRPYALLASGPSDNSSSLVCALSA